MKYYYTCSLQAAYMAKEFGMEFCHIENIGCIVDPSQEIRVYGKAYIHPDSIKLLEPQKYDVVIVSRSFCADSLSYVDGAKGSLQPSILLKDLISNDERDIQLVEILQRGGKHFFYPIKYSGGTS